MQSLVQDLFQLSGLVGKSFFHNLPSTNYLEVKRHRIRAEMQPGHSEVRATTYMTDYLAPAMLYVLTVRPMIMAERALRTSTVWQMEGGRLVYKEKRPGILICYKTTDASGYESEMIQSRKNPRAADILLLIQSKVNKTWTVSGYQKITLDSRELARELGYKTHPSGGARPKDILEIDLALQQIAQTWIEIQPLEKGLKRGRGNASILSENRRDRLIAVMSKSEDRDIEGKTCHVIWEVALGDWTEFFPRMYGPLPEALIHLSARGTQLWAKRIGTEICYWYRIDHRGQKRPIEKKITVKQLLTWACLMPEVQQMCSTGNHKRPRHHFQNALEKLLQMGIIVDWQYDARAIQKMKSVQGKPGALNDWLESIVIIHAPAAWLEALPPIRVRGRNPHVTDPLPTPN